jgi:SH3 domain-containing YSC84-like protein 1
MTNIRKVLRITFVTICTLLLTGPTPIRSADTGDAKEQQERAEKAATVLTEIMNAPDKGIPQDLLNRAHAIAVIPHMVEGAFGVGGNYGKGLVSKRTSSNNWGTPAFVDIGGGSFGLQIGVSATDLILVFMNEDGLKDLLKDKLEVGAGATATAGPVGRTVEAGTNVTLDSAIYSYSRSKGLFAGISLKGAVMTINDSANHKVYGNNISGKDILSKGDVPVSPLTKPYVAVLQKYVPERKDKG